VIDISTINGVGSELWDYMRGKGRTIRVTNFRGLEVLGDALKR